MDGMYVCPAKITKKWLLEIGMIGPKANRKQIRNAKRNAKRVCSLGLSPEGFVVDGSRKESHKACLEKGSVCWPVSYVSGQDWPWLVKGKFGGGGSMTDLGDPPTWDRETRYRYKIVGRAYTDGGWYFVYANGFRRPFTYRELDNLNKLIDLKAVYRNLYWNPRTGDCEYYPYLMQMPFKILTKEIQSGEADCK